MQTPEEFQSELVHHLRLEVRQIRRRLPKPARHEIQPRLRRSFLKLPDGVCPNCLQTRAPEEFRSHSRICSHCRSERVRIRKYGLESGEYQTLLKAQEHRCAICGAPHAEIPKQKFARACLAVDHDHRTGKVRGLLCTACNLMLGAGRDDPSILRKGAQYLEASG